MSDIGLLFIYFVGLPDLQQGNNSKESDDKQAQTTVRVNIVSTYYDSILTLTLKIAFPD